MDESFDRIDTIFANGDKFSYTTSIDTITSVYLLIDNQIEYPIFLDKGNQIKIKGNIDHLEFLDINGNKYNEEFTAFQKELGSLNNPSEKDLEQKAEEFITAHHSSFVSLYLLDKYFVQKDSPDFNKIKKLIEVMTGILQDKLYGLLRKDETGKIKEKDYAVIELPTGDFGRFIQLPDSDGKTYLMFLDDVIRYCLPMIFVGMKYTDYEAYTFKFTKDAEMEIDSQVHLFHSEIRQKRHAMGAGNFYLGKSLRRYDLYEPAYRKNKRRTGRRTARCDLPCTGTAGAGRIAPLCDRR